MSGRSWPPEPGVSGRARVEFAWMWRVEKAVRTMVRNCPVQSVVLEERDDSSGDRPALGCDPGWKNAEALARRAWHVHEEYRWRGGTSCRDPARSLTAVAWPPRSHLSSARSI